MKDVTKLYANEVAIKNLTMRVEVGESFAFLGLTGSGKSTVLKVLSGRTVPSKGGVYLRGQSIITKREKCLKSIGFCQGVSYYEEFTIAEYIRTFLMIHGYNGVDVRRMLDEVSSAYMYKHLLNKKLKHCSMYIRKKVNLSIALIGGPKLILIDEPTRGMDPFESQIIWKIINGMRDSGITLVITTFSAEEALNICDRFGILCNGELISVGTRLELVKRCGQGWILHIRMKEVKFDMDKKIAELKEFISLQFVGASLRWAIFHFILIFKKKIRTQFCSTERSWACT